MAKKKSNVQLLILSFMVALFIKKYVYTFDRDASVNVDKYTSVLWNSNYTSSNISYGPCDCVKYSFEDHPNYLGKCAFPKIIFFAFYVDGEISEDTSRRFSSESNTTKSKKITALNPRILLANFRESISIFHPSACLVVRTNNDELFRNIYGVWALNRTMAVYKSYTATKIAAQLQFYSRLLEVTSRQDKIMLYFVDPDMLLVGKLDYLVSPDIYFDMAVTVRTYVKMPINAGFLAVTRRSNSTLVKLTFEEMITISKNMTSVFADQIAMQTVFKCVDTKKNKIMTALHDLKVFCLQASIYNASPNDVHTRILKDTVLLHFKGDRKKFQVQILNKLKKGSASSALRLAKSIN